MKRRMLALLLVLTMVFGLSAAGFGPNENCNRAQVVTFLHRTYVN